MLDYLFLFCSSFVPDVGRTIRRKSSAKGNGDIAGKPHCSRALVNVATYRVGGGLPCLCRPRSSTAGARIVLCTCLSSLAASPVYCTYILTVPVLHSRWGAVGGGVAAVFSWFACGIGFVRSENQRNHWIVRRSDTLRENKEDHIPTVGSGARN
jgi:hypothetical protein